MEKPCFHPLKAGRRLSFIFFFIKRRYGFHPLKAGRRPEALTICPLQVVCFHPLKAGRRPLRIHEHESNFAFPSPQGGSETIVA